ASAGMPSNRNSASCRARATATATKRAKLRTPRNRPRLGRATSDSPSRVKRDDAAAQVAVPDPAETGRRDHRDQFRLARKVTNAFDQIAIGGAIAGDELAEQRHPVKAVEIVERLERRRDFRGEFETEKMPTWFEHTPRLGERGLDPG